MKPASLYFTVGDRYVALIVAFSVALMVFLPLALPPELARWTFSEAGPFEWLAIAGWLFAASLIIARIRPLSPAACAFALLFIAFAAREADWHKAFTSDSMLKSSYYVRGMAPIEEKLLAGAVALALVGLLLYVAFLIARFLFRESGWRSRTGVWLLFGAALVILGKTLDRAPAILAQSYGIEIGSLGRLYGGAFEEGLESITPFILAWSIFISQKDRRFL